MSGEGAVRRVRAEFDKLRSRSSYDGVGDEASGFTMAARPGGEKRPATLFLKARSGADLLHLEYTLQPSTEDAVEAAGTAFARATLHKLAG